MKKEEIMYGVSLGYKLGRLEFIWGSDIPEAISEFPNAKNDVIEMLKGQNVHTNDESYQKFTESILTHFERVNINIFATILVGIGANRNLLAKSAGVTEIKEFAKSAFRTIPEIVIPNPMKLYDRFDKEDPKYINQMVDLVYMYLNASGDNSVNDLFF